MLFTNKKKEYEDRIAQLEAELAGMKRKCDDEIQAERSQREQLEESITTIQNNAQEEIAAARSSAEQTVQDTIERYDAALAEEKARMEEELREEHRRNKDTLIALREHIFAEKGELMDLSDKELLVKNFMALSGFGTRVDRLEELYKNAFAVINDEITKGLGEKSDSILQDLKSAGEQMSSAFSTESHALVEALSTEGHAMVEALSGESRALVETHQETISGIYNALGEKTEKVTEALNAKVEELTASVNTAGTEVDRVGKETVEAIAAAVNPYDNSKLNGDVEQLTTLAKNIDGRIEAMSGDIAGKLQSVEAGVETVKGQFVDSDTDNIYTMVRGMANSLRQVSEDLEAVKREAREVWPDNLTEKFNSMASTIEGMQAIIAAIRNNMQG